MAKPLTKDQRYFIADKLMDSANYALAGLVFTQLLAEGVDPLLLVLGLLLYFWCWSVSVRLRKEVDSGGKS